MLLTTGQAAEELGCAVTTFRRLITAGVLPGLSRRGVRVMTPLPVVQALQERAHAPCTAWASPNSACCASTRHARSTTTASGSATHPASAPTASSTA